MILHCPNCGYSRKPTDTAPSTQCPGCGIVFAEFLSRRPPKSIATVSQAAKVVISKQAPVAATIATAKAEEHPKTTSCPACGGLVAFGAKVCPHCGKSKPAPKRRTLVTKERVLIALGLLLMLIVFGVNSPPRPMSGDEIARMCADEAGIPRSDPAHVISPREFTVLMQCTERYVGKR